MRALELVFALTAVSFLGAAQTYSISTIAGGAPPPLSAPALQAAIGYPGGLVTDSAGNLYITATGCVFKLDASGTITRIAGNGRSGYFIGSPATDMPIDANSALTLDSAGDIFGTTGNTVFKVTPAGAVTTVAGAGPAGFFGDTGPAIGAFLQYPGGIAVDPAGNIYVADTDNNVIRKVSLTGIITTIAGQPPISGITTAGFSGDGGPAVNAKLNLPMGMTLDSAGNLYIADFGNLRVRRISPSGIITTVAGSGKAGYSGDGGQATAAAMYPSGIAVSSTGTLYIADSNQVIRAVSPSGIITTVAGNGKQGYSGDGGLATSATLNYPNAVAVDTSENLYISDSINQVVRKVSPAGIISTVAGNVNYDAYAVNIPATSVFDIGAGHLAADAEGNIYFANPPNNRIVKISPSGTLSTFAGTGTAGYSGDSGSATKAQLQSPGAVAVGPNGVIYIADSGNFVIRAVSSAGIISTFAGTGKSGCSGNGGPATSAQFAYPNAVVADNLGNVYIADSQLGTVRKVSPSGTVSAVAGDGFYGAACDGGQKLNYMLQNPQGLAVDSAGNLYIADASTNRILEFTPSGSSSEVDNVDQLGPGPSNLLDVAVDAAGTIYTADAVSAILRRIAPDHSITTIAGTRVPGYSGDGGPATFAQLTSPSGLAVGPAGMIYVSDRGAGVIRGLTPVTTPCTYTLSPTTAQVPAAGGNVSLTLTTQSACAWSVLNVQSWVTLSGPSSGAGPASLSLNVSPNVGPARSLQIAIESATLNLNQGTVAPALASIGLVNAASYANSTAPGSIASLFGSFPLSSAFGAASLPIPTTLGGLTLNMGSADAPLFYSGPGQVNVQIPWEGYSSAAIAYYNGTFSATAPMNYATYSPGLFSTDSSGKGQGAILDANNRLVDANNPATPGTTVLQIFCTGLGPVTNQPATGAPSPSNPPATTTTQPSVTIGGTLAQVQFSGLTPGEVGLYQVNVLVPKNAPQGNAIPVELTIGYTPSNTVTIAVK